MVWDTTLTFCIFQCFLLSTVGLPQDGDSEGDSGFVTPDSTTKEKVSRFIEGEDVLSHGKDGLFYLGVIVVVSCISVSMYLFIAVMHRSLLERPPRGWSQQRSPHLTLSKNFLFP